MNLVMGTRSGQGDRRSPKWWSRLRGALRLPDRIVVDDPHGARMPPSAVTSPALAAAAPADSRDYGSPARNGVILPFPIRGEALLVKLAEVLRIRIAGRNPELDPLLLQISRGPRSRLSIDRNAYIEFHQDCAEYRAVIEASCGTKVILETADFDALVDFVQLYVVARLAEPAVLEAAS